MERYEVNEGRSALWDLDKGSLFIIEGTAAGVRETNKEHTSRFILSEVLIRSYDLSKRFDELPVIGAIDHCNCIRKNQGMKEYSGFSEGNRVHFIAEIEEYTTAKNSGILRRSFKIFRDISIDRELSSIAKRIRNLKAAWFTTSVEDKKIRLGKTLKMINRVQDITSDSSYMYIPWLSEQEIKDSLVSLTDDTNRLLEFTY